MIKYTLTKLQLYWYEIPVDRVKQLFEDERFTGEICHLYSEDEDGAESLIQSNEQLGDEIFEALENRTPFVLHSSCVYAQSELFEIREQ